MLDYFWLAEAQIERLNLIFHWVRRVDDRRHHLCAQARAAMADCGPHKALCNRFRRWSEVGVASVFKELSSTETPEQLQMDTSHLKAHRTANVADEACLFRRPYTPMAKVMVPQSECQSTPVRS